MDVETLSRKYRALELELTERSRRLWAASEAREVGHGGIALVEEATGVSRSTITRGIRELESGEVLNPGRTRRPGGGRKRATEKAPTLLVDLESLVEPTASGDPDSPLRWTSKSVRRLAGDLTTMGHEVSHVLVADLLHELGYSLQANLKTREGRQHPDRDAQFRYINDAVRRFQKKGEPAISVDTKKKELIGDFKNPGREWRPKGSPERVRVHDFLIPEQGKAIPSLPGPSGWHRPIQRRPGLLQSRLPSIASASSHIPLRPRPQPSTIALVETLAWRSSPHMPPTCTGSNARPTLPSRRKGLRSSYPFRGASDVAPVHDRRGLGPGEHAGLPRSQRGRGERGAQAWLASARRRGGCGEGARHGPRRSAARRRGHRRCGPPRHRHGQRDGGGPPGPPGIRADRLSDVQRDMLMESTDVYTSVMAEDVAAERTARLRAAGIENIAFAWASALERGQPQYYRVQGPTFLIEYDNTQNDANHIHSVWREFEGDFGRNLRREHLEGSHHRQ